MILFRVHCLVKIGYIALSVAEIILGMYCIEERLGYEEYLTRACWFNRTLLYL